MNWKPWKHHCWIDTDHCIQFEHDTILQQKFGNLTLVYYFSTYSGIILYVILIADWSPLQRCIDCGGVYGMSNTAKRMGNVWVSGWYSTLALSCLVNWMIALSHSNESYS